MKLCLIKRLLLLVVAIGCPSTLCAMELSQFTVSDSDFIVQYKGEFSVEQKQKTTRWLVQAAEAVTTLYGRFPESKVRVVLVKTSDAEPVSWGQVNREDVSEVVFYINPDYSLARFQDDWVAVHEFSHLLLPYAGDNDIWMSEGLATYYQNVLRARHGMITEKLAWKKMIKGFNRGESDTRYQHLTLEQVSPVMRRTGSFMRVYWAGTAYFFNVDIDIRRLTGGESSLGEVLSEFNHCCQSLRRHWSGIQLATKLDEIANLSVFVPTYVKYKRSFNQPDTKVGLHLLGVSMEKNQLVLRNDAALSGARNEIMNRLAGLPSN